MNAHDHHEKAEGDRTTRIMTGEEIQAVLRCQSQGTMRPAKPVALPRLTSENRRCTTGRWRVMESTRSAARSA